MRCRLQLQWEVKAPAFIFSCWGCTRCVSNRGLLMSEVSDAVKYQLPLTRALHFIEKGTRMGSSYTTVQERKRESTLSCDEPNFSLQEDAARYAAYHCHHMLTSFRAERRRFWMEVNELSVDKLSRVMEYLFFAALLLHLTALYETADKYCESLINVAMSCTIFLSKNADILHHFDACSQRHKGDVNSDLKAIANQQKIRIKNELWSSLHWAIVHFSQGVCAWGLLDHTVSLFNMERTLKPCCGILRTFARITTERFVGENLPKEEIRFLSAISKANGSEEWLGVATVAAHLPKGVFTNNKKEQKEQSFFFAQQRRLQLLPLFWVALLSRHCALLEEVPHRFLSARYALLRLLPLFQKEAKADTVVKLLVHSLYFSSLAPRASSVEMGILLAQMERYCVFPLQTSAYNELLCAWMHVSAPQGPAPEIKNVYEAYAAFCNIPRCALHVAGHEYTSTSDGYAFVHELLLHAFLEWSHCLSTATPFCGELEELLRSARHLASLFDYVKLHGEGKERDDAVVLVFEAIFRGFAVRVAAICAQHQLADESVSSKMVEFDCIIDRVLRGRAGGHSAGCVPDAYEAHRQ